MGLFLGFFLVLSLSYRVRVNRVIPVICKKIATRVGSLNFVSAFKAFSTAEQFHLPVSTLFMSVYPIVLCLFSSARLRLYILLNKGRLEAEGAEEQT
jgi:hypothetical protein